MNELLPGYQAASGAARRSVLRNATIYTPLFVVTLGIFLALIIDRLTGGEGGGIIILVIVGLVAVLLGFQSIEALRDLRTDLTETRGTLRRKWSRSDFIFWRSHYLQVGDSVFSVQRIAHELLQPGDDIVIEHYPHTGAVESLARVRPEPPSATLRPQTAEPSAAPPGESAT